MKLLFEFLVFFLRIKEEGWSLVPAVSADLSGGDAGDGPIAHSSLEDAGAAASRACGDFHRLLSLVSETGRECF